MVINFLALQLSNRALTKLPGVTVKTTAGGGSIANFQEEPWRGQVNKYSRCLTFRLSKF